MNKKLGFLFALVFAILVSGSGLQAADASQPKELKVLMIGNSFSQSVLAHLPNIVKSVPGCKLILAQAYIGGCSLERHCAEYQKSEADPKYTPYGTNWNFPNKKANLQMLLGAEKWDIVTIQQGSPKSWDWSSYQPYADELVGYVRKFVPDAEIVVHQTWAYRSDDGRIFPGHPSWGFEQKEMYDRLTDAYTKLAKHFNARIIPVGYAVQLSREKSPVKYVPCDSKELKTYSHPDLPRQAGDVVGNMYWTKDRKSGAMNLQRDTIHLGKSGEYLQACVWFAFLFNRKTSEIAYEPNNLGRAQVNFLKAMAQEAVDNFPQVKK